LLIKFDWDHVYIEDLQAVWASEVDFHGVIVLCCSLRG
jgi:hypothetical protein